MASGAVYGGDDIGSVVIDPGSSSIRFGYAQDEFPKADVPSSVGIADPQIKFGNVVTPRIVHANPAALYVPRKGLRAGNFTKDGVIDDWEIFEKILDYGYEYGLHTKSEDHPVIMSEIANNPLPKREKLMEIMFEKYKIPAFFLVNTAVLSAFASGRCNAMILDSGATHTSALPVHEGHLLSKSVVRTTLAGDFITAQCKEFLQREHVPVVPPYMISNKKRVIAKETPSCVRRKNVPDVTMSWHENAVKRVIQDFKHSVISITECPLEDEDPADLTTCHYEFPNGYHQDFGIDRFEIGEMLFNPPPSFPESVLGASKLILSSMAKVHPEARSSLFTNIVLTGGNTLLHGFVDRVTNDILTRMPNNVKVKVIATPNSTERRFSSWIGGSILASVGTFQQMWISRKEYFDADSEGESRHRQRRPAND